MVVMYTYVSKRKIYFNNVYYYKIYYKTWVKFTMLEGKKEMFNLTTHSTHFIYGYMVKVLWDTERGNLLSSLHGLIFQIRSKRYFICISIQTGKYVNWLERETA